MFRVSRFTHKLGFSFGFFRFHNKAKGFQVLRVFRMSTNRKEGVSVYNNNNINTTAGGGCGSPAKQTKAAAAGEQGRRRRPEGGWSPAWPTTTITERGFGLVVVTGGGSMAGRCGGPAELRWRFAGGGGGCTRVTTQQGREKQKSNLSSWSSKSRSR